MDYPSLFFFRRFSPSNWFRLNLRFRVAGLALASLATVVCSGATLPGTAPVTTPAGGFGIDGDLLANTPTNKIGDWVPNGAGSGGSVLAADGTPLNPSRTFHVRDLYSSMVDDSFTAGKYDDNPNTGWQWHYGAVANKVDINNAVVHITSATNGHQWAVVSGDRLNGNGDSYIDFEFLQDALTLTPTNALGVGGFTNAAPHGGRRVNDFLLTLAFTGGGSVAAFYVQQWETNAASGGYDYFTINISNLPPNSVFAAVNPTNGTVVPYGAFGGTNYGLNTFAEAAVDLTALIGASFDPCTSVGIRTIMVKTKQSASPSAALGDMVAPIPVDLTLGLADAGLPQTKCSEGTATTFQLTGNAHPNVNAVASMSWSVVSSTSGASIDSPASCSGCTTLPITVHVTNAPSSAILRLTVTDVAGCTVTDDLLLTVNPGVTVDGLTNQTVCAGGTTTFTAIAGGTGPFSYQWTHNGSPMAGATNNTLTLSGVSQADAGSYSVSASGTCGAPATLSATLTVNDGLAISSSPASLTKCPGDSATFSVGATGTGLSYQWFKGTNALPGATGSSLTLSNVSAASADNYSVTVSGACGAPVTLGATLTVNQSVAISSPPASLTQCPGDSATFSVGATGTGLSYQWFKGTNALAGATGSSLTLSNVSAANADNYSVTVSGACGAPVTLSATLTVNQSVAISSPPASLTKCPGDSATFTVGATGTGLSYQWFKGTNALPGATGSSLTLNNVSAASADNYSVTVSGACGAPVTLSATLTVNQNPAVSGPPASLTQCPGDSATFSVSATGTGLSYQWFKGTNALAGATGSSLTLSNVSAASAGNYSVTVSGACGASVTSSATLTVNQSLAISTPPASLTKCPGDSATFSVSATGTGLSYQWFEGTNALPGETGSSLTLNNVSAASADIYSVTVSATCGAPQTLSATLTVNQSLAISSPPVSLTNCPGDSATFSVGATGTGLSYQWFKGTNALSGATGSSLTLSNVSAASADNYSVTVSGACGAPVTLSATLAVNQNPAVSTPPANLTKCPGDSATFSVSATGTGLSYQWFKGTNALAGATGSSLTVNNVSAASADNYSVTVSGACGAPVTSSATLTVNEPVTIDPMLPQTNCLGGPISLNAVTHGTGPFTYIWIKEGKVLPGATGSLLQINSTTILDAGLYTVVASGACTKATNTVQLLLYQDTMATPLVNQTNCFGRDATFSTTASGSGPFTYVWKKDGVVIAGQTGSSITIQKLAGTNAGVYTVEVTGQCTRVSSSAVLAVESDGLTSPTTFINPGAIQILDFSPASPYPSTIDVFCVPKPLTSVSVTVSNLSHSYAHDIDMLLLSPSGKAIMLMSDAGSYYAVSNATLTFSATATNVVPEAAPIVSGVYYPTNYGSASDNIPEPAPLGPYALSLAEFNGTDANGTWGLFVIDDAKLDSGVIAGGWSLTLGWETPQAPVALTSPAVSSDGTLQAKLCGQVGCTYVIEGSTDLVHWTPISTNTLVNATGDLLSIEIINVGQKFYRAVNYPSP
jgi:subtilisin-like proprotein convertase family protein